MFATASLKRRDCSAGLLIPIIQREGEGRGRETGILDKTINAGEVSCNASHGSELDPFGAPPGVNVENTTTPQFEISISA